ncbi:EGH-like protein [Mya arenaria]|uniref:EGH-like protein n=1 Tax=Mya arenaria TaxID=6604 RepID=A0ABY7EVL6_MYAAR|nr:beta-1,4-mannosyltransferase egh-like [Mya arenaria]XP_052760698.1 beta-1,4-mannosyltransferase egh-like [Mya arenaria]XP_052760699.1 beta-1,4-mannosyltransferase egh-like [Mya arenaria]XP_052760700.1 beta-1,4-mannosyltransferase egh-like [Mya arenaria]XP_052760701.1 beta-1,4-mannosyltransferase egh-like [Mya arenaria]WAR14002.1 EGH-like protein [Mya arenaria]
MTRFAACGKISRAGTRFSEQVTSLFYAIGSSIKHVLACALLVFCIYLVNLLFGTQADQSHLRPLEWYGRFWCIILYTMRCIPYLSVPFAITNLLGIVTMNTFPRPPTLKVALAKIPFMCFRVVTRGSYPDLVRTNVERNIKTCYKIGLDNFKFEVVTDKALNLPKSSLVRELVVPNEYRTKNNSLFKARALHYCNEPAVNILSNDDWVIHLDEETLLTESSTIGLANFATQGEGDIGQGVISYANEEIVNWLTTLADSVRVSVDLGMMRFSFRKLGCPLMGFKGSYIIVRESVEKDIGFDFGPKGSVAEDVMFALIAWGKGYKFNFVEGEMWEKSPFTIGDYIKQRKRWFVGHVYTLLSSEIPLKCKLGMIPTDLGWFLLFGNILNLPLSIVFPVPLPVFMNVIAGSMGGTILFLFVFGSIKSFSIRKHGLFKKILLIFANVLIIPLAACLDAIASLYGYYTRDSGGFHIVLKETQKTQTDRNQQNAQLRLDVV